MSLSLVGANPLAACAYEKAGIAVVAGAEMCSMGSSVGIDAPLLLRLSTSYRTPPSCKLVTDYSSQPRIRCKFVKVRMLDNNADAQAPPE